MTVDFEECIKDSPRFSLTSFHLESVSFSQEGSSRQDVDLFHKGVEALGSMFFRVSSLACRASSLTALGSGWLSHQHSDPWADEKEVAASKNGADSRKFRKGATHGSCQIHCKYCTLKLALEFDQTGELRAAARPPVVGPLSGLSRGQGSGFGLQVCTSE
ncbi:hypothetical protein EYF80_005439 [Liparis tanakae]|uniref:Uncharacterized protein n=1 Tax=Liparis tanakae TaxID=230148 RepID=A0A4Z2J2N8_9TELE|nr:hypothetical protein EYF80_005439 [Liparis tanakae]